MIQFIVERLHFISFVLLSLFISALLVWLRKTPDPDGEFGLWRGMASWYIMTGTLALIVTPNRRRAIRAVAWSVVGAGSFFYSVESSFWYFWLPVGVGALIESVFVAFGVPRRYCGDEV